MPIQDRPRSPLLDVPEADGVIKAATGQGASIRAPRHAHHPVRMPRERLETASAFHIPQLDRAIKARTGELRAIGCEGQPCHPVGMSRQPLHTGARLWHLRLPHPDAPVGVATGEQPPIWTPGQRVHRAARSRKLLHLRAALGVPQLDEGIIPATGEQVPIRSKGHTVMLPVCQPVQSKVPLSTSQSLTVVSQPPLASWRPSGLKARADPPMVWACQSRCRVWPASCSHSHTRTFPSQLAAAQYCPFLLMVTVTMSSRGSVKTLSWRTAPESRASCISTPCKYTPRRARRERSRPRKSPRSSRSSATRFAGPYPWASWFQVRSWSRRKRNRSSTPLHPRYALCRRASRGATSSHSWVCRT